LNDLLHRATADRTHQVAASGSLPAMTKEVGWALSAVTKEVGWALLAVVVAAGCGSSKSNENATAPTAPPVNVAMPNQDATPAPSASVAMPNQDATPAPNPSAEVLNPPANIDVKSCVQHVRGSQYDIAPIEACGACCSKNGFTNGTFEYKDLCTCGRLREPANDTLCATPEAMATSATCEACCKKEAYRGYLYASGTGGTTCSCEGRTEDKACAGKAAREACWVCCYNAGYFGVQWTEPSTCLCAG
jgi:hypothetical protein